MILTDPLPATVLEMIGRGEFDHAAAALGNRWRGVGLEPARGGESDAEYGFLLMLCGILTQELGEMQLLDAQAAAKDLLTKAIRLLGDDPRAQQARFWLGLAYLRCGEHREALAMADALLSEQTADSETVFSAGRLRSLALMNLGDLAGADAALGSIFVFLPTVNSMAQGRFYLNRSMVYRQAGRHEEALADNQSASFAFRAAKSARYEAATENNRAGIYIELRRFEEAQRCAEGAIALFQQIGDHAHEAKAWDQLAQVFAGAERFEQMEKAARRAIALLSDSDHEGWLAEALITHGIACARVGMARAGQQLERALEICQRQGDPRQADLATAAMWQIVGAGKRVIRDLKLAASPIERDVCERVLRKHDRRVRPAARELGITHQALLRKLQNHFPELLEQQRAPRRRHKSILKHQ